MRKVLMIFFFNSVVFFSLGQSLLNYPGIIYYDLKTINPAYLCPEYKFSTKFLSMNEVNHKYGFLSTVDYFSFDMPLPKLKSAISFVPGIMYKSILMDHDRLYKSNQLFFHFTYNYNLFKGFYVGLTTSFYYQNASFDPYNGFAHYDSLVLHKKLYIPDISIGVKYENHGFVFGLSGRNLFHVYHGAGVINSPEQNLARQIFLSIAYSHKWNNIINQSMVVFSAFPDHFNSYFVGPDILIQDILSYKKLFDIGINANVFPNYNFDFSCGMMLKGRFLKDHFHVGAGVDFYDFSSHNKTLLIPFNILLIYNKI